MAEKEISFVELSNKQDSQINTDFTTVFEDLIQEFDGLINSNINMSQKLTLACELLKTSINLNKTLLEKLQKNINEK
ncbi:hypothetical protein CKF54_05230 [Psittacicella hinzii]|uniref:Uncharacterized protein n=1 Tax=Psittacicella hinzii TaxID=2028575 RepID=A0A3A1Y4B3_9GAMM|nr:hypothetical protein [Psittacicella hinzii]RIY32240.1 hypothetical protein CKF54_05230 [Psittacicella hinzii]